MLFLCISHFVYIVSYFFYRLPNSLGRGQFGEVYKATWRMDKNKLDLAVKTLKSGASEEDKVKFLQEAAIIG